MNKVSLINNFLKSINYIKNFTIENLNKNKKSEKSERNYETGIVLTTYNRLYVEFCLEYLSKSELNNCIIVIIDDNSTEVKIYEIIEKFNIPNIPIIKIFKKENKQINDSLRIGWNLLSKMGVKYLTNIDSDTLVKKDWLTQLKNNYENLKKTYGDIILTGFNTKNHKAVKVLKDHLVKNCVGGVNIFMSRELYNKLNLDQKALNTKHWDWAMCNAVSQNNSSIIALKNSVIQHIGFNGMHSKFNLKKFDFAYDFIYDYDKNFYLLPSIDSPGFNKNKIEGSLDAKMKASLADKNIIGFNSNGEMKTKIKINEDPKNLHEYKDFQGLFIKKSEINKVEGLPLRENFYNLF